MFLVEISPSSLSQLFFFSRWRIFFFSIDKKKFALRGSIFLSRTYWKRWRSDSSRSFIPQEIGQIGDDSNSSTGDFVYAKTITFATKVLIRTLFVSSRFENCNYIVFFPGRRWIFRLIKITKNCQI